MQFSLKKYITEKYLTEKLQSDTLVNDILNDKGGMFIYYKMDYPGTLYYKAKQYYKELKSIIENTFQYYNTKVKDDIYYKGDGIISDDDKRALHKKYMELYNQYIKCASKLFTKPDPQLLPSIAFSDVTYGYFERYRMDLFNLTDEHFEKYTLQEIKKDKSIKDKVSDAIKHNLCFWFDEQGKILVASCNNTLKLFAIDNNNPLVTAEIGRRQYSDKGMNKDEIENAVKQDNLTVNTLTMPLNDGTELKFPTIARLSFIGDKKELVGIDFVDKFLYLHEHMGKTKLKAVGSITSKASNLQKLTGWGATINDYVIIYYPEQVHKDFNNSIISTYTSTNGKHYTLPDSTLKSYNDYKTEWGFNKRKNDQREAFDKQQQRIYKWVKDLFGKYKPYANGDQNRYFKYGVKLSEYDYNDLYGDDEYCNKIAENNVKRYKALIAKNRSMIGISNFNEDLKKILPQLQAYTKTGNVLCTEIKKVIRADKDKFKSLMTLYGLYSKVLQSSLIKYGNIQVEIATFKKEYTNSSKMNNYQVSQLKQTRDKIKEQIDNLLNICDEISQIETKINETLNN